MTYIPTTTWQYLGSQALAEGSNTITATYATWQFAVLSVNALNGGSDVVITRDGKTSASDYYGDLSAPSFNSGTNVSATATHVTLSDSGNDNTPSGTAYFYR